MLEAELRDLICKDVSILESGLTLINKEKYIPNELGTRSFIDIYAKDEKGHHVLIEIKRSNQASREAINEIIKYVEGVKRHLGARDDEIRVIIASTEWKELLVPYSRFIVETSITIKAISLHVTDKKITTSIIAPLHYEKGRFFAPWYDIHWYENKKNLNRGISSLKKRLSQKGIDDYILTVLKAGTPIKSPPKERRLKILSSLFHTTKDVKETFFSYILIVSIQVKTIQEYREIIKNSERSQEEIEDILSISEDDAYDDEAKLCLLHENAMEDVKIESDYFDIGYPAKFQEYLNNDELDIHELIREGIFKRNSLLEDSMIISELCGDKGNSRQSLKVSALVNNNAHMSMVRHDVIRVLQENIVWQSQIIRILNEIEKKFPEASIDLNIFYPSTGVFSIYYTLKDGNAGSLPKYVLSVSESSGKIIREYFGHLQPNGIKNSFNDIIKKYYSNNLQELIHSITWGGRDDRDIDILEDMGLSYKSFYVDILNADIIYLLSDERWRSANVEQLDFSKYFEDNKALLDSMMREIMFFDQGDIFSSPDTQTTIIIEKEEVDNENYKKIFDFLEFATSSTSAMEHFQGKLNINFNGYENDPELYEIKNVREYLKKLFLEIPFALFFIDSEKILPTILLCHLKTQRNGNQILIENPEIITSLIEYQTPGLEELLNKSKISEEKKNAIRDRIQKTINRFIIY